MELRKTLRDGRVMIKVDKENRFYGMSSDGWILESRYIMAQQLGRELTRHEEVIHKNNNNKDNRVSNLKLRIKMNKGGILKQSFFVRTEELGASAKDFVERRISSHVELRVEEDENCFNLVLTSRFKAPFSKACLIAEAYTEGLERGRNA